MDMSRIWGCFNGKRGRWHPRNISTYGASHLRHHHHRRRIVQRGNACKGCQVGLLTVSPGVPRAHQISNPRDTNPQIGMCDPSRMDESTTTHQAASSAHMGYDASGETDRRMDVGLSPNLIYQPSLTEDTK